MKKQRFEITLGPHEGMQGDVDMIFCDHLFTGDSPDIVMGPLDDNQGYWKGTTSMCRVFESSADAK